MIFPTPIEPRLRLQFTTEVVNVAPGFDGNTSSLIPASTLGNMVSLTSELMRTTWDYALSHPDDERFSQIRRINALKILRRRDLEFVIVGIRSGSIEIILDWQMVVFGLGAAKTIVEGMLPNAAWDLTKYSFQAFRDLLFRNDNRPGIVDPMTRELLPIFAEIVRTTSNPSQSGISVSTKFTYRDRDEREITYTVDQRAQQAVLEANRIETRLATRILGSIVAVDYIDKTLKIQSDQFSEKPIWGDASGIDFDAIEPFVTRERNAPPKIVALDVEAAWRQGARSQFPPEAIRIIGIIPAHEAMRFLPTGKPGLISLPIDQVDTNLNQAEVSFLKWFDWADKNWSNIRVSGVVNYIQRKNILPGNPTKEEVEEMIYKLI